MDRTLTALARERYRPARVSVLAPWALERTPTERLALDVALRWEEAADALLELVLAQGARRSVDGPVAGEGSAAGEETAVEGEETTVTGRWRESAGGVSLPVGRRVSGDAGDVLAAEEESIEGPFAFDAPHHLGADAPDAGAPPVRPRAPAWAEEGGRRPGESTRPAEIAAGPRGRARPDALEAPEIAAAAGDLEATSFLPRPASRAAGAGAPAPRGRVEGPPALGPATARSFPAPALEDVRAGPRPAVWPPDVAPGHHETRGFGDSPREDGGRHRAEVRHPDRLAIEALLDDLRRREEALEEWARTEF